MKKVLFALVLVCGIFAFSSCGKDCTCVAKYNGEIVSEVHKSLKDGEKCSDYNSYIKFMGQEIEQKCTPNLF